MFSFRLTSAAGIITSAQAIIANSTGTVTYVGDWTIHTFTTSGSFTFQSITGNPTIEYLVVGGGGGGGGGQSVNGGGSSGGGGGAGGFKLGSRVIQVAETLSITVGDGGIAGVSNNIYMSTLPSAGGQGNASQIIGPNFASIAGNGGGGGSGRMLQAGTGGSGGGGGPTNRNGSGLPGHGYGGGLGFPLHTTTDAMRSGGGGGGALGVGNNATSLTVAGTGGPGNIRTRWQWSCFWSKFYLNRATPS
jgi:MSHA biogenesis protein MshQ